MFLGLWILSPLRFLALVPHHGSCGPSYNGSRLSPLWITYQGRHRSLTGRVSCVTLLILSPFILRCQCGSSGNLGQVLNRNGWVFHMHIAETYGSVVRIDGVMGVSNDSFPWQMFNKTDGPDRKNNSMSLILKPCTTLSSKIKMSMSRHPHSWSWLPAVHFIFLFWRLDFTLSGPIASHLAPVS
jgi:hypothetical protein